MQEDFYQRDYLDIVGLAATRANTLSMGHASGKKSPWLLDKTLAEIPLFFVAFFLMYFLGCPKMFKVEISHFYGIDRIEHSLLNIPYSCEQKHVLVTNTPEDLISWIVTCPTYYTCY